MRPLGLLCVPLAFCAAYRKTYRLVVFKNSRTGSTWMADMLNECSSKSAGGRISEGRPSAAGGRGSERASSAKDLATAPQKLQRRHSLVSHAI